MITRRPRILGPLLAALAAAALLSCACSEDTPTENETPAILLPAYYIQSGSNGQSVLVGWAHLPVSPNSGEELLEAAYYLYGEPFENRVEILWVTGAADPRYDWTLGREGGPWLRGRIAAEGGSGQWGYVFHGWGELAIEEQLGEPAAMPLVFDPLSPLSHALLARRWQESEAEDSLELEILFLPDARATPILVSATLHDDGQTEQGGFALRSLRLEAAGERFFTKVMIDHFPIPYVTWWEGRQLSLQFVGEKLPVFVDEAPEFPAPAGYTIAPLSTQSGGMEIRGEVFVPDGEGPFPGCLLLSGDGPAEVDAQPLLRYVADDLARFGWLVYRPDKPGTGASQGDLDELDLSARREAIADLWQALVEDPRSHPSVRVLIGHGEGAALAMEFAAANETVSGILALAPPLYDPVNQVQIPAADQAAGDFAHFLGLDCFVGKYRDLRLFDSLDYLGAVACRAALFRGELDERVGSVELEIQAETIGSLDLRVRHLSGLNHHFTAGRPGLPPGQELSVEMRDWLDHFMD